MANFMWTPTQAETLGLVSYQLHLGIDVSGRRKWMFCPIPYHNPPICAHSRYYIGILWLISGFIDFAFMVDPLYNVELDLHLRALFRSQPPVAADLFSLFIVICSVEIYWFR